MDKFFLLIYTCIGYDGFRHEYPAWFETEEEMRSFAETQKKKDRRMEVELSIEILSHRTVEL